jgi:hypothetical protein
MRTAVNRLHLSDHQPTWWLGHAAAGVAGTLVLVYLAAVLLVVAVRILV